FGAEHYAANQPGRTGPADQAHHGDEQEENLPLRNVQGQCGADCEQQVEPRQREEQFAAAHENSVEPAAVIPGDAADEDSDRDGENGGDEAGEQGNLAAVEEARKLVAAVGVSAHQEYSCGFLDAGRLCAGWDEVEAESRGP